MDAMDKKILKELQRDSSRPVAELAERVNLSTNACWRRIKQLKEQGIIRGEVVLVDQDKIGKGMTAFVQIRTSKHDVEWLKRFSDGVKQIEEVVEFHRMSGNVDYLLKVIVASIADYDRVYKEIIKAAPLHDVTSYFSMERLKETTEVPLGE